MKKRPILIVIAAALVFTAKAFAYDSQLIYVLEQLRHCTYDDNTPMVGGSAIGFAGRPHEFYLLFPYVDRLASEDDLKAMLRDKSAVVRLMAVKCILGKKYRVGDLKKAVDVLEKDTTKVFVAPAGCDVTQDTVAGVLKEFRKNPDFLGDAKVSEPAPAGGRGAGQP
jgi:hypothetical protein